MKISLQSKSKFFYIAATIFYMCVIFMLSSLPAEILETDVSSVRKILFNLAHVPLYGILAFLLSLTIQKISKRQGTFLNLSYKVLILSVSVAVLDEMNQRTTPGRTSSIEDVLLDIIGISIALWIIRTLKYSTLYVEK